MIELIKKLRASSVQSSDRLGIFMWLEWIELKELSIAIFILLISTAANFGADYQNDHQENSIKALKITTR